MESSIHQEAWSNQKVSLAYCRSTQTANFSALGSVVKQPRNPSHQSQVLRATADAQADTRMQRGAAALAKSSGGSGETVVRSFDDIAPDIGRMIVEHSYGDIFSRPGIDPKTRELTACAALAAKGTKSAEKPLRVHVNAALKCGATRVELVETMLNLLPYCGYPAVKVALAIVTDELALNR